MPVFRSSRTSAATSSGSHGRPRRVMAIRAAPDTSRRAPRFLASLVRGLVMRLRPVLAIRGLRHEDAVRTIRTMNVTVAVHNRLRFREETLDEQLRRAFNDAGFDVHGKPSVSRYKPGLGPKM